MGLGSGFQLCFRGREREQLSPDQLLAACQARKRVQVAQSFLIHHRWVSSCGQQRGQEGEGVGQL